MAVEMRTDAAARSWRLVGLLQGERGTLADFVIELAEFDRLRQFEALGYATLWAYCSGELKLSKGQIFYRTNAAYAVQKARIAADYLRDGRLCMTTLHELSDVLTAENARELLDLASWKQRDEVAEIAVSRKPKADAEKPSGAVRKLPVPRQENAQLLVATANTSRAPAPKPQPLAEDWFSLNLRFDRAFKEKLERVTTVLGHRVPDRDPVKVFMYALDLLLEREEKRRGPPRKEVVAATGDGKRPHIPADLARAVWQRDEGKCVWTLASGKTCGSEWQIEIDHIVAVALGGKTVLENLRLLCRAHNQMHARETFGRDFIERKLAQG